MRGRITFSDALLVSSPKADRGKSIVRAFLSLERLSAGQFVMTEVALSHDPARLPGVRPRAPPCGRRSARPLRAIAR